MKKFIYLSSLFVLALFMNSCDSDDDNNGNQPIVGTWELFEINTVETFNGDEEETIEETLSLELCEPTPVMVFTQNGSLSLSDFEINVDFDDEVESCEVFGEVTGTWEFVSGNTYILESENEPIEAEITFTNGNNRINIKLTETDEDGTYEYTYRGNRS